MSIVVLEVVWAINEISFPYFIKLMVENISTGLTPEESLWQRFKVPILGISITWILMEISMRIYGMIETYVYPYFRAKMRQDVFDYVKNQSVNYFTSNLSGNLGSKVHDIPKSSHHIVEHFMWQVIAVGLVILGSIVVTAQANIIFSLILMVWCSAHMGVTFYYFKEVLDKNSIHYESVAALSGETIDTIGNALNMKFFSRVSYETKRLKAFQEQEIKKSIIASWASQKVNFIRGTIGVVFILTIIYFLLKGWKEGWLTAGDFPLVAMSCFNLMGLVWNMSIALLNMFRDIGILDGALSLMREEPKVIDKPHALPLVVSQGEINVEHIDFSYHPDKPIFSDLSIHIKPQEKVGLVGFSGSGKTTFANLILRSFDLNKGRISIDGQDISQVTQSSLREQITFIPQDSSLFHRTIRENISYGLLEASHQDIEEAAHKAHCHEFIKNLEKGYNTLVGERGLKLSGGQRQRLSIARAFLKNSPIIILDEATSALDSATEKCIQDSLLKLIKEKTTLIIAHRLSTLKHMDRILVFHKGKIVEEGTQKQLLKQDSFFAHLWSLQQEGFLPEEDNNSAIVEAL